MDLPTWSDLPESQISNRLISQAITDAISAHESDPEAHLGVGESLQNHRQNDIIDHPQNSIPMDKFSSSELLYRHFFESLDVYPDSDGLLLDYAGDPYLNLEYGFQNNSYLEFTKTNPTNFYNENKFITLSFFARFQDLTGHLNGSFAFGNLRFVIVSDVLKARFYRSTSYNEQNLSSVDIEILHFYQVIYNPNDELAYFYIDGVLVATLAPPSGSKVTSNNYPIFDFTVSGGSQQFVHFGSVSYSRSL